MLKVTETTKNLLFLKSWYLLTWLVKKFKLPCSQESTTELCSEIHEYRIYNLTLHSHLILNMRWQTWQLNFGDLRRKWSLDLLAYNLFQIYMPSPSNTKFRSMKCAKIEHEETILFIQTVLWIEAELSVFQDNWTGGLFGQETLAGAGFAVCVHTAPCQTPSNP